MWKSGRVEVWNIQRGSSKNDVIIIFMLILTETNMYKYKMLKKLNSIIVYLVFKIRKKS